MRSSESNDSQKCVGRYGWITRELGHVVGHLAGHREHQDSAAMAPIGCSVSVEMASPIAPSAAIAAATYRVT